MIRITRETVQLDHNNNKSNSSHIIIGISNNNIVYHLHNAQIILFKVPNVPIEENFLHSFPALLPRDYRCLLYISFLFSRDSIDLLILSFTHHENTLDTKLYSLYHSLKFLVPIHDSSFLLAQSTVVVIAS